MRIFFILSLCFAIAASLTSCNKDPDPYFEADAFLVSKMMDLDEDGLEEIVYYVNLNTGGNTTLSSVTVTGPNNQSYTLKTTATIAILEEDDVHYSTDPAFFMGTYTFTITLASGEPYAGNASDEIKTTHILNPANLVSLTYDAESKTTMIKWDDIENADLHGLYIINDEDQTVFLIEATYKDITGAYEGGKVKVGATTYWVPENGSTYTVRIVGYKQESINSRNVFHYRYEGISIMERKFIWGAEG